MFLRHPASCAQWAQHLKTIQIPVLRSTRDGIEAARAQPDRADANSLADLILRDPLMTLRVLIHVTQKLGSRLATPVETVTAGLVLTGIEPFFRDFTDLPVLDERLASEPLALDGALRAIHRSHRAAQLAAAFAIHRMDEDVEVLHQAALLDNFAGLLVCCEAPGLVVEVVRRQRADPTLRSVDVQREMLGTDLAHLEQELMASWGLPTFLRHMTDATHNREAGPQSVMLAVRIARHSQDGWDNAALPDDWTELGLLLNMPPHGAQALVYEVEGLPPPAAEPQAQAQA